MIIQRILGEMAENNHFQSASEVAMPTMASSTISSKPAKSDRTIRKLWALMTDAFGHRWVSAHGEIDSGGTWARGLAGLTGADIARGMSRVVASGVDWPPGLPEFRALCEPTPDQIGAPTGEVAFIEACRNAHPAVTRHWSHPAVYHAACEVGLQNLLRLGETTTRGRFQREYLKAVRMVIDGEALRIVPDESKAVLVKLAAPEVVHGHLAKMRSLLGVNHAR